MRFKYLRDPLFLACVALYFTNRLVLKPLLPSVFLHSYLNDLICIPFWVPIMLAGMRFCRLRHNDAPPRPHEILVPLLTWSVVFECWLPHSNISSGLAVADHLDILCYVVGATIAGLFWRHYSRQGDQPPASERA